MRVRFILVLLLLLFCRYTGSSQYYNQQRNFLKANSVWLFGIDGAGLDFNRGTAVPLLTSAASRNGFYGSASVADTAGQLLFYVNTSGIVYNRHHVAMTNGTNVGLGPNATQMDYSYDVMIVPVIDTPWKYFVFTSNPSGFRQQHTASILYSVVNMSLDNGLGAVEATRKNVPLYHYNSIGRLIAIPGDQCDIWLLSQTEGNERGTQMVSADPNLPKDPGLPHSDSEYIMAWHITPGGIDPRPVLSPALWNGLGYYPWTKSLHFAVSPDRSLFAVSVHETSTPGFYRHLQLYKFDPFTGKLSDGIRINRRVGSSVDFNYREVAFSPDNSKLYLALGNSSNAPQPLLQYDVSVHNPALITASEYMLMQGVNFSMKLYNDTIYTAGHMSPTIDRITNPNAAGGASGFQAGAVSLIPPSTAGGTFTQEVVYPVLQLGGTALIKDTLCYMADTGYVSESLSIQAGFYYYEWDNGERSNARRITQPGTYWVRYENMCQYYLDTFVVTGITPPLFSLGPDTTFFCQPAKLELKPDVDDAQYLWQNGSSGDRFQVIAPGTYWVEANKAGCIAADTIQINEKIIDGIDLLNIPDTTVCAGEQLNIVISAPALPGEGNIRWSDGSTAPDLHIRTPGVYYLTITYPSCSLKDSLQVRSELCECTAQMPTAFSPNGDGHNDSYRPVIQPECLVGGYTLTIYNRWGERVYTTNRPMNGWDGYYKGQPADVGTYHYQLNFTGGTHGKQYYTKGDITLIR